MDNIHTSRARAGAAAALAAILSTTACAAPQQPLSPNAVISTYEGLQRLRPGDTVTYAPGDYDIPSDVNVREGTDVGRAGPPSRSLTHKSFASMQNPAIVGGERADGPSHNGPGSNIWGCSLVSPEAFGLGTDGIFPRIFGCVYHGSATNMSFGTERRQCAVIGVKNDYIQCADGTKVGKTLPSGDEPPPKSQAGGFKPK